VIWKDKIMMELDEIWKPNRCNNIFNSKYKEGAFNSKYKEGAFNSKYKEGAFGKFKEGDPHTSFKRLIF
jgi:hypothetical protein